jgi:butyrate kinase
LREEMEASTDRFFSPEVRNVVASRMVDAAISIRARKGAERATDVLAVARAVKEAGLITAPPREIPFLVAFMQKGISIMAHQGGGSLRIPMAAPQAAPPAPPADDAG